MIRLLLFTVYLLISFNLSATLYSEEEINTTINKDSVIQSSKEFVRGFFTAQKPMDYVENYTSSRLSGKELLILEHQLYNLLNQVAQQPKQQYLQDFVNQMKTYQIQTYKIDEEGRMQRPVYSIHSRAKGIENIWQAAESVNHYSAVFKQNPISAINALKNKVDTLSPPRWLGLKNSIKNLSVENKHKLATYFLSDINNIQGLDKYVSHFTLLTTNKELLAKSLLGVDKTNGEYVLRSMAQYFSADFVAKMLVTTVENKKNQAFALSLMNTYVDTHSEIKQLLFDYLKHIKFSSNAAFALSYTKNSETLKQLEDRYINSESSREKKHIIFCLQMNKSKPSKTILKQLLAYDNDPTTKAWINQFNRESK